MTDTKSYSIHSVYSYGEYGPYGSLTIDGIDNRQVEIGDAGSGCDALRMRDFREAGLLDLISELYRESDDDERVAGWMLRDDVNQELVAALRTSESAARETEIDRIVEAHRWIIGEDYVIDCCPRGFCNERESILLPADQLEAGKAWAAAYSDRRSASAEVLTADEYCDNLVTALEGADDPTTNPRSGVAELGDLDCDGFLRVDDDTVFDGCGRFAIDA